MSSVPYTTLHEHFEALISERDLTFDSILGLIKVSQAEFDAWCEDPLTPPFDTAGKIRAFTENPDGFLSGKKRKAYTRAPKSKIVEGSAEDYWAFAKLPERDLVYVGEVLQTLGLSSVTPTQARKLVALRKRSFKK